MLETPATNLYIVTHATYPYNPKIAPHLGSPRTSNNHLPASSSAVTYHIASSPSPSPTRSRTTPLSLTPLSRPQKHARRMTSTISVAWWDITVPSFLGFFLGLSLFDFGGASSLLMAMVLLELPSPRMQIRTQGNVTRGRWSLWNRGRYRVVPVKPQSSPWGGHLESDLR